MAVPDGWQETTLGAITTKIGSGATPRGGSSVYTESGTVFIRSQNVLDHEFSDSGLAYIDDSAASALAGVEVRTGDVLLNITGDSILRCCQAPDALLPARVSQHVSIIRPGVGVHPRFLQKYLTSSVLKDRMLSVSDGATRKAITKASLEQLQIEIPPAAVQVAIAEVLDALDDKIAANRKLVGQLRTIAQAEFSLSTREDSAAVTLSDVAVFHNRRRAPLSAIERGSMIGKVPYYGATGVFDYVDRALFDEILLLVGEDGSVVTEDGHPVTQYIWGPAWVNNHAHVLTGASISTELLTLAVERASIVSLVTGAVQPKVSMGNLKKLELLLPDQGECERLNGKIQPLFGLIRSLTEESRTLTDTRDALLPGLMSGEVRVRDAEISVEQGL